MIDWWGPILHEYYAATEANGITMIDSPTWLSRPGSVGRSLLGVLHVCDDDGTELPTGEVGTDLLRARRAAVRLPQRPGQDARRTAPASTRTGRTTGDIGYVDADGFLFLTDRKAFMIISGGVNIYPQEIENALTLHPAVLDLAVIGIPDPRDG